MYRSNRVDPESERDASIIVGNEGGYTGSSGVTFSKQQHVTAIDRKTMLVECLYE